MDFHSSLLSALCMSSLIGDSFLVAKLFSDCVLCPLSSSAPHSTDFATKELFFNSIRSYYMRKKFKLSFPDGFQ